MWFRYERSNSRWCPVVYHQDRPADRKPGEQFPATNSVEVPQSCVDVDGSPNFGRLQAMFPPPEEKKPE